jgi:hypothetical protein
MLCYQKNENKLKFGMKWGIIFVFIAFISCQQHEIKKNASDIKETTIVPNGYDLELSLCFQRDYEVMTQNPYFISNLNAPNCLYVYFETFNSDSLHMCKINYTDNSCQIKSYSLDILKEFTKKTKSVLDSLNKAADWEMYDFKHILYHYQIFSGIDYVGLIVSAKNFESFDPAPSLLPKAIVLFDTLLNFKHLDIVSPYNSVSYIYNYLHGSISTSHSDTLFIQDIGGLDNFACISNNEFLMDYPKVDTVDTYYFNFVDPYTSEIVNGFVDDSLYTLKFRFYNKQDVVVDFADATKQYKLQHNLYSLMHNGFVVNKVFYSSFNVYDDVKNGGLNNVDSCTSFIVKVDLNKSLNPTLEFYKFTNIQIESLLPTLGGINFIYNEYQHSNSPKLGFLN